MAGRSRPSRTPMIAITTSNSIRVKAVRRRAHMAGTTMDTDRRRGMNVLPCSLVQRACLRGWGPGFQVTEQFVELVALSERLLGRVGAELVGVVEARGSQLAQDPHRPPG